MNQEHQDTIAAIAMKASPPVAVGSSILAGYSMSDFVLLLTAIYTCIQIGILTYRGIVYFAPKWRAYYDRRRKEGK